MRTVTHSPSVDLSRPDFSAVNRPLDVPITPEMTGLRTNSLPLSLQLLNRRLEIDDETSRNRADESAMLTSRRSAESDSPQRAGSVPRLPGSLPPGCTSDAALLCEGRYERQRRVSAVRGTGCADVRAMTAANVSSSRDARQVRPSHRRRRWGLRQHSTPH